MNREDKALYDQFAAKHGTVQFEGKHYALIDKAELTNMIFPDWWGDAREGEEYLSEWHASAMGQDGYDYVVTWRFETVKGEEPEDDSDWPWDTKPYSVIAA